jgi:hypothetical protein
MLPLDTQSLSDIVPSPSVPVICRFHHHFCRFCRFCRCLSFSSFAVAAVSAAASIYHYRHHSKSPTWKTHATSTVTPREFIPAPPTLKGHICLIVVTTTSPAHTELALLMSKSFLT